MKVYSLAPNENWIVDRIVEEFNRGNHDIATTIPEDADVLWIAAEWCWRRIPMNLLQTKNVVTTIHHIVEEKFDRDAQIDFAMRDDITDVYHVPNEYTCSFISKFTKKPIVVIPYWANQNLWSSSEKNKYELREKFGIPNDAYVIGSFQRDTEGASCDGPNPQPKLEKGPDLLADAIVHWHETSRWRSDMMGRYGIHVVLAGWRRQYIIKRLEAANVPYTYFEKPPYRDLRELYQTLDLYPVTARVEGGPQSLIECGLLGIPVVSRPIGIASHVLSQNAINENVTSVIPEVPNVNGLTLPDGFQKYRSLFEGLHNG